MIRWLLAALHLLGLGIALGAAWARAHALRGPFDTAGLQRVFHADNWWGVSALLLIGTGLLRAFGGYEKGSAYYLHNHVFLGKMALLVVVLLLELGPMVALVRWRTRLGRGEQPDTTAAPRLARISFVQAVLVALMVLAATAMARGYGTTGG
jgi:putative membrane protein